MVVSVIATRDQKMIYCLSFTCTGTEQERERERRREEIEREKAPWDKWLRGHKALSVLCPRGQFVKPKNNRASAASSNPTRQSACRHVTRHRPSKNKPYMIDSGHSPPTHHVTKRHRPVQIKWQCLSDVENQDSYDKKIKDKVTQIKMQIIQPSRVA